MNSTRPIEKRQTFILGAQMTAYRVYEHRNFLLAGGRARIRETARKIYDVQRTVLDESTKRFSKFR